ncbi:MAG: hypothetical protein JKY27_11995 [Magnetovibrio sp.]|nr:hypothetical protein [Magnetovibrio sp.]
MDAAKRIDDLLFITTELIELLEQENAALLNKDLAVINQLLDRKLALSRAYEIRFFGLKNSEDDMSEIDPALIEVLKERSVRLDQLVDINSKALKVGVETGKRFMSVLSESVKTATPSAGTYGADGMAGASSRPSAQTASVAYDKVL